MQNGRQVKAEVTLLAQLRDFTRSPHAGTRHSRPGVSLLLILLLTSAQAAQDLPPPPIPVDPTPLVELISPFEKTQLASARGAKKQVEALLKISEAHLEVALSAIKNGDSATSERELDIYCKATAEAMKASASQLEGRRSLAKKIEQSLYRHIKSLETIELMFPVERQAFGTAALKHAKALRVQALNAAFASGETLKGPDEPNKPESEDSRRNKQKSAQPRDPPYLSAIGPGLNHRLLGKAVSASGPNAKRVSGQLRGDYLTEEEDQKVREAQTAETRAKAFMRIADRRLSLITGTASVAKVADKKDDKKDEKKAEEEEREWGALKTTSRAELLKHYSRAIEECMAKLEDAYERNPKSSGLSKALSTLREATDRQLQALRSLAGTVSSDEETAALRDAIEQAEIANKGARDGLKSK